LSALPLRRILQLCSLFGFQGRSHQRNLQQLSEVSVTNTTLCECATRAAVCVCSGDDITNICRDAAMNGMRRKIAGKTPAEIREMSKDDMKEPITMEDFMQVCKQDFNAQSAISACCEFHSCTPVTSTSTSDCAEAH
jgi:SpoVK/Ycf46/Vps4 family AAA+-type ATPase